MIGAAAAREFGMVNWSFHCVVGGGGHVIGGGWILEGEGVVG